MSNSRRIREKLKDNKYLVDNNHPNITKNNLKLNYMDVRVFKDFLNMEHPLRIEFITHCHNKSTKVVKHYPRLKQLVDSQVATHNSNSQRVTFFSI